MSDTTLNKASFTIIDIDKIVIGERLRKDLGDIDDLITSIKENGLWFPVLLATNNHLADGYRRIEAHKRMGLKQIQANIMPVADLFEAEMDANNIQKRFSVSERVEGADKLIEKYGNRQGKRTDLNNNQDDTLRGKCPEVGEKTSEFAARKSGFGSEKLYRSAKFVVENAIPEVIDAMDKGAIAISCAKTIAENKKNKQLTLLNESISHPGTEKSLLDEGNDSRRRAKRNKRFNVPDGPDADPIYNIIRVAPDWEIELVSDIMDLRVADYIVPVGIVLVECPMEHIADTLECIDAWGFHYAGLITAFNGKATAKDADHLSFVTARPWHVIVGYKDETVIGAELAKIPAAFDCHNPQATLDKIIGHLCPNKKDTRLDMSGTEPRKGWKVWKLDYKTKE